MLERKYIVGFVAGGLAGLAAGIPLAYALFRASPDSFAAVTVFGAQAEDPKVTAVVTASHEALVAGKPEQALELINAAKHTAPRSAPLQNNLCVALIRLGRYDDAIAACNTALTVDPHFQLARNNLSWAEQERAKRRAASASVSEGAPGGL